MSRRKQSNPKPLKRSSDEEDGSGEDKLKADDQPDKYKLPTDILELQACDEEGRQLTVCGAIRLPKGSSLGPFQASLAADDGMESDPVDNGPIIPFHDSLGKETLLRMGENGQWLSLLKRKNRDTANCSVYFDGDRLWCELQRDILIHSELTAVFSTERVETAPDLKSDTVVYRQQGLPDLNPPSLLYSCGASDLEHQTRQQAILDLKPQPSLWGHGLSYASERSTNLTEQPCAPEDSPSSSETKSNMETRAGRLDVDQPSEDAIEEGVDHSQSYVTEQASSSHPLIYFCPFCSVRFSSPRTLDAHIQFYCSKKPMGLVVPPGFHPAQLSSVPGEVRNNLVSDKGSICPPRSVDNSSPVSSKGDKRSSSRKSSFAQDSADESTGEKVKPRETLRCDKCSYTAARAASMNRHKRIHNRRIEKSDNESLSPVSLCEMYCVDCNIQFSSMNTYRGHKEYYCPRQSSANSTISPGRSVSRDESITDASVDDNKLSSSPGSKVKVELGRGPETSMYSGVGGIVLPAQFLSQTIPISMGNQPAVLLAAPILASSGMANITMPTIIVQPVIHHQSEQSRPSSPARRYERISARVSSPSAPAESAKEPADVELPLDLSTKRLDTHKETTERDKTAYSDTNGRHVKIENGFDQLSAEVRFRDKSVVRKSANSVTTKSEPCSPTRERQRTESSKSSSSLTNEPSLVALHSPNMLDVKGENQIIPGHYMMYEGFPFLQGPHGHLLPNQSQIYGPMLHEAGSGSLQNLQFAGVNSMSQHVSKCMECNIVFYKHENYLIHKKHYCASRKRKRMSTEDHSAPVDSDPESSSEPGGKRSSPLNYQPAPKSPKKSKSPETPSPDQLPAATPPIPLVNHTAYQRYYCTSCCIKFSSADTLKAHKDFYCLDRKSSDEKSNDVLGGNISRETNPGEKSSIAATHSCPSCSNCYPSARLLKLHFCKDGKSNVSLLRCLYCDFVAQTESKYIDHMKAHAPSKVYRCAICGYRGNTVRGMRMHGKMHVDEGHEFTDEHMVEYEEPPHLPATLNNGGEVGPLDVEEELIRLKNEPYKRRRSRKSYEKSEYCVNPRKPFRHVCSICFDVFQDAQKFSEHMQLHVADSKYGCRSCDFSTDIKADLVDHMLSVHSEKDPSIEADVVTMNTESDSIVKNCEMADNKATPNVVKNEETDSCSHNGPLSKKSCSSTPESPASAVESNGSSLAASPNTNTTEMDVDPGESPEKENIPVTISTTSHSRSSSDTRGHVIISPCDENESNEVLPKCEKPGPKYCKYCDINFTFLSSFLAHRRYYCNSRYHGDMREDGGTFSITPAMRIQH